MSWPLIRLALHVDGGLRPIEKLVLIALANQIRPKSVDRCWPSIETIAGSTLAHERTVQIAIGRLQALGLIRVERGGGRYRSSVYVLDSEAMKRMAHDHRIEPGNDGDPPPFNPSETVVETVAACPERVAETARNGGVSPPEPEKEPEKGTRGENRACAPAPPKPLPENFPRSEETAWAIGAHPAFSPDVIQTEADKFRNYHSAKATTSADWPASWRTWMRREEEWRKKAASKEDRQATLIANIVGRAHAEQRDNSGPGTDLDNLEIPGWRKSAAAIDEMALRCGLRFPEGTIPVCKVEWIEEALQKRRDEVIARQIRERDGGEKAIPLPDGEREAAS